jgi:integrase
MPDFYRLPDEIPAPTPRHDRKLLGQKPPLRPRQVWAIRIRLQIQGHKRDLALFNLAIDSKLRSCDLVALRVQDICLAGRVKDRAVIIQQKTGRPVQFELTDQTRQAAQVWIAERGLHDEDYVFPSRVRGCAHLSTRQYSRIVDRWVASIGLDPQKYGTHSMRRTKAALIYRKTGNLRAVQLLLGHTKLESTVRYLGIEVDDALQISEQVEL